MALDQATLQQLEELASRGDGGRAPYYQLLASKGDPYAKLARGVVLQNMPAGIVARLYALEVARRYCNPISPKLWIDISVALMRSDLQERRRPESYQAGKPSLLWTVIRDYHKNVFASVANLPAVAWTAWIPLQIVGESGGAELWHRMLTEDFIRVSVETTSLVLFRLAQEAGVLAEWERLVTPLLKVSPPLLTRARPANPGFDRCMVDMANLQMVGAGNTAGEKMAFFYLDCLASGMSDPIAGTYPPPVTLVAPFPLGYGRIIRGLARGVLQ